MRKNASKDTIPEETKVNAKIANCNFKYSFSAKKLKTFFMS